MKLLILKLYYQEVEVMDKTQMIVPTNEYPENKEWKFKTFA